MSTTIEWTKPPGYQGATCNCFVGCTLEALGGCDHCYAMQMAYRLGAMALGLINQGKNPGRLRHYVGLTKKLPDGRVVWTGRVHFVPEALEEVRNTHTPTCFFTCSMGDLFHRAVTDEWLDTVFDTFEAHPQHLMQALTKRPARLAAYLSRRWANKRAPQNIWVGTSVESQTAAAARIPHLLRTPATVRFLSCEPLLGPVDLSRWLDEGIDWVIAGGESGHYARPPHPGWFTALRDQCRKAGVPFFFKQWGAWKPICSVYEDDASDKVFEAHVSNLEFVAVELGGSTPQGQKRTGEWWCHYQPCPDSWWMARLGKKEAGRLLDGRTWDEFPSEVQGRLFRTPVLAGTGESIAQKPTYKAGNNA